MSSADAAATEADRDAGFADIHAPLPRLDAFRRAQDHSRHVRLLRMVLPAAAFALAGGFVFTIYQASAGTPAIRTDSAAIADGQLVMALPKLKGFTKEGRTYKVDADQASQALSDGSVVNLSRIDAVLPVDKKAWMKVQAPAGVYDREANTLTLDGGGTNGIKVVSSDNMTVFMRNAVMDLNEGTLKATDNVDVTRAEGDITSEEASYSKDGKTLVFEKKVRMTVDPRQSSFDKPSSDKPAVDTASQ